MRISDWSSDVCSSDLTGAVMWAGLACSWNIIGGYAGYIDFGHSAFFGIGAYATAIFMGDSFGWPFLATIPVGLLAAAAVAAVIGGRSEEHTSELQSLMRISYAVFCLKKKTRQISRYKKPTQRTQ